MIKNLFRDFVFDIGLTQGHVVKNPIVYVPVPVTSIRALSGRHEIVLLSNVRDWLNQNCTGKYKPVLDKEHVVQNIAFSRKSDAVLFVMTFNRMTTDDHDLFWFNYNRIVNVITTTRYYSRRSF